MRVLINLDDDKYNRFLSVFKDTEPSKYYLDNLWHVDDVKEFDSNISDDVALQILDRVLNSESIVEHIKDSIRWHIEDMNYNNLKEESI
jgi:hypothetical protein